MLTNLINIPYILFLTFAAAFTYCGHKKTDLGESHIVSTLNAEALQDDCNWCGTSEAPDDVSWRTIITPDGEPGIKLIVSGTVFHPDGETPAEGVVVYVHHTNIEGVYPKKGDEPGNGKYHGYLRGWMKTDKEGRYEFETIRPAPYQTHGGEPAHIHYNVEASGYPEYWLTALWFDDDPRVTEEQLDNVQRNGGFSNITSIRIDKNNILRGTRNIILQRF